MMVLKTLVKVHWENQNGYLWAEWAVLLGGLRSLFLEHRALFHSSFGTREKRSQKPEDKS